MERIVNDFDFKPVFGLWVDEILMWLACVVMAAICFFLIFVVMPILWVIGWSIAKLKGEHWDGL